MRGQRTSKTPHLVACAANLPHELHSEGRGSPRKPPKNEARPLDRCVITKNNRDSATNCDPAAIAVPASTAGDAEQCAAYNLLWHGKCQGGSHEAKQFQMKCPLSIAIVSPKASRPVFLVSASGSLVEVGHHSNSKLQKIAAYNRQ